MHEGLQGGSRSSVGRAYRPSAYLRGISGSAWRARFMATMSDLPEAMISSAMAGSLIELTVSTIKSGYVLFTSAAKWTLYIRSMV